VRWVAVNLELLVLQSLVFAVVRGVEGAAEWMTVAARASASVLIGAYIASFARRPGWLPAREEEEPLRPAPRRRR
jgi:hypothetical protein